MAIRNGTSGNDTLIGTVDADLINGFDGNDTISAGDRDDTVDGGDGDDTINAGNGDDTVFGQGGADQIEAGIGNDSLDAGPGVDTLLVGVYSSLLSGPTTINLNLTTVQATGAAGNDYYIGFENVTFDQVTDFKLIATPRANLIDGSDSSGDDKILSIGGNDTVMTGGGNDTVGAGAGDDSVMGEQGNDRLYGAIGNDTLDGGTGNDLVSGQLGDDSLVGDDGDDVIFGQDGADTMYGGAGRDVLTGGGADFDVDVFEYNSIADSTVGANRDVIRDFEQGFDVIDLSGVDAQQFVGGDQAFDFIGSSGFSGSAGELRAVTIGNKTVIQADVDGNGTSDMDILLNGAITLTAADFVL